MAANPPDNKIRAHQLQKGDRFVKNGSVYRVIRVNKDGITYQYPNGGTYYTIGRKSQEWVVKIMDNGHHLWPEMLRAIREIAPQWVVGENVRGLVSWNGGMVFDEVQSDLEAAGYEILPFILPACAVNAPP